MQIDISEILSSRGKEVSLDTEFTMPSFRFGGVSYTVTGSSPLRLQISGAGSRIHIGGHIDLELTAPCSRCLGPVSISCPLEIDRSADFARIRAGLDDDPDDVCFINEESLDTDVLVFNELIPHLPMKILCREDCAGLCPVCGQDLNRGECGCDRRSPNLQMSAIMDIFNSKQ